MNRNILTLALTLLVLTFSAQISAQCTIAGLVAEASDCDGGNFWVTINFDYNNVGNQGFKVQGNGNNYGNFSYSDLPITIGPLSGDGVTVYEFVAIDIQHNDCSDWDTVGPISCGDCQIWDLSFEPGDCNNSGNYNLWIDFEYSNPTHTHFDVIYNNQTIGFYELDDLPILIENFEDNGENSPYIQVCINDNPNCCAGGEFLAPNCNNCVIWDLHSSNIECDGDNFFIVLNFNYNNVGNDGFNVHGNGNNYGSFSYSDLPIVLGPLPANGTFYEFAVNDNNHPDCSDVLEYGVVDCSGGGDCNINELVVEVGDCNNNGTYNIWLNFEYQNAGNELFDVIYENQIIGTYHLNELPIWIENFVDNGETNQGFLVCINDNPNCCEDVGFVAPNCEGNGGDCEYWDFFAEAHPCNNDGLYLLDFEFNSNNTGNDGFVVIANGTEYGPFEYGEDFYTIGPLHSGVVYEILIQDVAHPDCQYWNEFGPIFCDSNCHIYHLNAELSDCDDEGQFYVTLDFDFVNVGDDGFKVAGNGNVYGYFNYNEVPITLGPFEAGSFDQMEFVVTDVHNPNCGDAVVILVPDCEGNSDCSISDLVVDITDCQNDGTFYVVLEFEYSNTGNIGFRVDGNGINYGLFGYDNVPVSIGPLVGNGTTPYEFVVSDLNYNDCHDFIEIEPVDCDNSGDCIISELVVDPGNCHNDGSYNLWVNFEYQNVNNIYFDVYYKGQIIDYFPLASLPVVIPHFQSDGEPVQEITICINDNPNCCATVQFDDPQCMGPNITWPGDTDFNNIANNFDLLNIGLAYQMEGPPRDDAGIDWFEFDSPNWDEEFATGLNFKHADCNGNGIVDKQDIQAIIQNYNKTHGEPIPSILLGGSESDPPLFADLPSANDLGQGTQFYIPINLGSDGNQIENIYGIAFTIIFDPEIIDPLSVDINFSNGWLGVPDQNLIVLDKSFAAEGRIEVGLSRSNHQEASGYGEILGFIGIIDNIAGKEEMKMEIKNVKAIRQNETLIPLYRPVEVVDFAVNANEVHSGIFKVYPNPAQNSISITHPENLMIDEILVKDMNGREISKVNNPGSSMDVSMLSSGMYILQIKAANSTYYEKLIKH